MPSKYEDVKVFYASKEWRQARKVKRLKCRGLCERCGKKGYEVHHKIYLTDLNYKDPDISLNLDNLELLCTNCHNAEHNRSERQVRKDLTFDIEGNLIKKQSPPQKHRI